MTPGTTYYYRAKADGDGRPCTVMRRTSPPPTTPPSVTTNDATNVTTASATLNGDLTSLGTADNVTVSFEWGTARGSYTHTTADQSRTSVGAFSADLSGLTHGTTYYYRAKADGDGAPVYGDEKNFTTPTTAPSVTTNDATNVTTASATLNGDLTSLGTAGSVTVSFEWGLTEAYGNETPAEVRTDNGTYSFIRTGLAAKTTYHFRAKAVGDGTVYGNDTTFRTLSIPPSVTTNNATNVTTSFSHSER